MGNMNKCRICLKKNDCLKSINDIDKERGIKYIDLITSITNIKREEANYYQKICSPCQQRVSEAYDFKILIEQSNMILQNIDATKIIRFNNVNEIKKRVEIKEVADCKTAFATEIMKEIESGKLRFTYNSIIITKLENEKINKAETPEIDFIKSIKSKIKCEDFQVSSDIDDYNSSSDKDDYIPWKPIKNKNKKKMKLKETKPGMIYNVCIKPVLLEDIRVVYYDLQETLKRKRLYRLKYKRKIKKDVCCYCGKLTRFLKSHQLVHTGERKFKCDICSKTYYTQYQLNSHKKSHLNTKSFKCDLCIATCENAAALNRHKITHSDVRSYLCNICNKGYKRKYSLLRHIKQHNSENRNIKCEFCSMMFYTKPALKNHMRVHTGERPYKCQICSQPYSYKRDFNRHCLKKHGVFLNRRSVNVMNDDILKRERAIMKELLLRKQGVIKGDQNYNPFEGPQAALAFEQTMQALENRQIHEEY